MNTQLLITFILLNIANVIIQTVKSLATINCGKTVAALVNAFAYGLYTIVTIYMLAELPLFLKAGIVALCNLIGVYVVKWAEEKARKDKLWKVEASITRYAGWEEIPKEIKEKGVSCNYIQAGKYAIINCYCNDKQQSKIVKEIFNSCGAKYFVSESKTL